MIVRQLKDTCPPTLRLGQWFVNHTGYHSEVEPSHTKVFYAENEDAILMIVEILTRWGLWRWTYLTPEQWVVESKGFFKSWPTEIPEKDDE